MTTFVVHLSDENVESQASLLREEFPEPQHYRVSERFYLVRADALSDSVAQRLGFNDTTRKPGSVFKLNRAYAGWDKRTMWEWLALGERSG